MSRGAVDCSAADGSLSTTSTASVALPALFQINFGLYSVPRGFTGGEWPYVVRHEALVAYWEAT